MTIERVLLARPRGLCAGVEMAVRALDAMLELFDPPVFCYHEIVHNRFIVEDFRERGVVFVDHVDEVPVGAPLMMSAHGSGPDVIAAARARTPVVVDAACPLVARVHHEARTRAAMGYSILYVGHRDHDEALGLTAVAPDAIRLVEHEHDVDELAGTIPSGTKVALLAQTTLAVGDWQGIADAARAQFPDMWMPARSDLCYATTNRQRAVAAIAPRSDAMVVIGSANSSNTLALAKVARQAGCAVVQRVDDAIELDMAALADARVVGVTAGASAPDALAQEVIARLAPTHGVEEVEVTEEQEYFPLPRELRRLQREIDEEAQP